ncbi:sensor histidine kinase [Flexithrix dorotheae]|uniref:sensor histidine kinase n=1 Tax=Flexithrix dorotheae TaxID=70993 RepID=UPI00037605BB|nr:sensor histidine kinase [Flexithrix dorotheae]
MKINALSIKFWINFYIISLISLTVAFLTIFDYREFKNTLDQRVLLHLTSIKRLKRIQIEEYLEQKWIDFKIASQTNTTAEIIEDFPMVLSNSFKTDRPDTLIYFRQNKHLEEGIYDKTEFSENGKIKLAFVKINPDNQYIIQLYQTPYIQHILVERTGMGESGETYLVGEDFNLRSISRFMPKKPPFSIHAQTVGSKEAISGKNGSGIFEDYRGVMVYSAYHTLEFQHIKWAILSEIDVEEATQPLWETTKKLIFISVLVIGIAFFVSLVLTNMLSQPVLKMRNLLNTMAKGNYEITVNENSRAIEMNEMFSALKDLTNSINGAIQFSKAIGEMKLDEDYQPSGKNDMLGESLLVMRQKLKDFNQKAEFNRKQAKKSLITGQEKERKRLAMELHDGLGPLLTSMKLYVQTITISDQEKEKLKKMLDDTIREIRQMSYNLMPLSLIDFGVGKALNHLVGTIRDSSEIDIQYDDNTKEKDSRIDTEIGITIFRITQELINNTLKHAKASMIRISLTEFDDQVSLFYADNGKGFETHKKSSGAGLKNIRERVNIFNGYLSIESGKNGTTVEVEIDLLEHPENLEKGK